MADGEIPYDPNQIVEVRTEWQGLEVPTDPGTAVEGTEEGGPGGSSTVGKTGVLTRADRTISEIKVCQETLRQALDHVYRDDAVDQVSAAPNFDHTIERARGEASSAPEGAGEPSVVASVPVNDATPTAGFDSLKGGLEDLGDRIQEVLANLDLQIDYERTDKGARVRIRNVQDGATPTDVEEPTPTPAPVLPVREIRRDLTGGGAVTISVRPSGPAAMTADGGSGAAANNNTIGYITKRTNALIANEFGVLYSVINLGLTFQFLFGVENE
jgi:hypothetical protein